RRAEQRLYQTDLVDSPSITDPAVHAALGALDVKHRSVVVCRHLLGWSVAETADALHLREGTVKSRLHRANQILQDDLAHLRTTEEHA
ncbi:MAG: polymerase sigma-70 factor, subfamily, partial [Acidimicrobiaceae bacterium]